MNTIKTIFIGTSYEGVSSLKALIDDQQYEVTAVVTQPDKPSGRKKTLTPTPIKEVAVKHNLKVYAPENSLRKYKDLVEKENPDLAVTIAFGEFLPKILLDYPRYKCLNVHYSLLPQLRGAVPVQMAILRGLAKTGITVQIMNIECDTGPILTQKDIPIEPDETTLTLKKKLIPLGKDLLMNTLKLWTSGKIKPDPQDTTVCDCCYRNDISKENAAIDWNEMDPEYIDRMIRAFLPWPVAWTIIHNKTHDNKRLKIFEAEIIERKTEKPPGTIVIVDNSVIFSTKDADRALSVKVLQLEGKNKMTAAEFSKGWKE